MVVRLSRQACTWYISHMQMTSDVLKRYVFWASCHWPFRISSTVDIYCWSKWLFACIGNSMIKGTLVFSFTRAQKLLCLKQAKNKLTERLPWWNEWIWRTFRSASWAILVNIDFQYFIISLVSIQSFSSGRWVNILSPIQMGILTFISILHSCLLFKWGWQQHGMIIKWYFLG